MPMITTMCPMDALWRKWALFSGINGRLDRESQARVTLARQARRVRSLGLLDVKWETAPDDDSVMPVDVAAEPGLDVGSARHTHGDVIVAGHWVHLDIVATRRSNPTFAFRDWRIYVDGVLEGRAPQQQCGVGDSLSDLPAVALVGRHAVTLTGSQLDAPQVELWATVRAVTKEVKA
jgi:hypothetical protein